MPGVFKKIKNSDRSINPFKVYKSWSYTTTSSLSADGIGRLCALKPDPRLYTGGKLTLDSWETASESASALINDYVDRTPATIWYSLDHLYYKKKGNPLETFGNIDHTRIRRELSSEASVISVPQRLFGEYIRPGSVKLELRNSYLSSSIMSLKDDGYGNLIDTNLSSSISGQILYLGFNQTKYDSNWTDSLSESTNDRNYIEPVRVETTIPNLKAVSKNVWYTNLHNIPTSSVRWGESAEFHGNGYIRINNSEYINFTGDYAISFWLRPQGTVTSEQYILSKRTTGLGDVFSNRIILTGDVDYKSYQYPYDIHLNSSGQLICKQSDGIATKTAATSINTGSVSHVVFQKTGSNLQLYVNGVLADSSAALTNFITNKADLFIGSLGIANGVGKSGFSGSLDEFFMFNSALSQTEVYQLYSTGAENMQTNSRVVGNVFYEHGIIVLTDPRPKYGSQLFNDVLYDANDVMQSSRLDHIYLEFNSTMTIYEHEYLCRLDSDEFNFTMNPTIRLNNDQSSEIAKPFTTGSEFSPYLTTVGLYNDYGDLLAVAKLATPIKKRDDVDLTIIVKFDM